MAWQLRLTQQPLTCGAARTVPSPSPALLLALMLALLLALLLASLHVLLPASRVPPAVWRAPPPVPGWWRGRA